MGEFCMPALGADMERGTIVEWRVGPGDVVHRGDIVAVVETDKATIEIEVFQDGTVTEILVEPGAEVLVGTALATISPSSGSTPPPVRPEAPTTRTEQEREREGTPEPTSDPTPDPTTEPAPTTAAERRRTTRKVTSPLVRHLAEKEHIDLGRLEGTGPGRSIRRADVEHAAARGRVRSSPLARRRAQAAGIDLHDVSGTGPGGAVVGADITGHVRAGGAAPGETSAEPRPPVRRPDGPTGGRDAKASLRAALATLMARSKREIPHYYLSTPIDMANATSWLASANEERPIAERILAAAVLLRATTKACLDVPVMNGHWIDGRFAPSSVVHLGVAVRLRTGGLLTPAIRDADSLSLDQLMARLRDVVGRVRAGRLRSSDMTDPTITVTNLGDQGVDEVFGVIYPPQVAIVGFGRIAERPWAEHGMLAVRPVVTATLSADHRASDGTDGARFLTAIDRHLQQPELL